MKRRRSSQALGHIIVYILTQELRLLALVLPYGVYRLLALLMGFIGFGILGKLRRLVLANLETAFGESLTAPERQRITRRLFTGMILNAYELAFVTRVGERTWRRHIRVDREDALRRALAQGKGVVAVCSHMGNFPLGQAALARRGFPVVNIARYSTNPYFAKMELAWRAQVGMPGIGKWNIAQVISESREWLKQGNLLFVYLDQHAGNGVPVPFFGRTVRAPAGAAVFARKYGCPVVGVFTCREKDGRHRVFIEGPYDLQRTGKPEDDIRTNTAFFMQRVEYYVRLYPEQWFSWLSNRFR